MYAPPYRLERLPTPLRVTANNFTQSLAKFTKLLTKFCMEVSKLTDGTVTFGEDTNNEGAMLDKEEDVLQLEESRKRKKSDGNDDAVVSAKKKVSKESTVNVESQQEISENHIGS